MDDRNKDPTEFYEQLTPLYHLVYSDWGLSLERQCRMLDSVIREQWGDASEVLDVSCGIGTQALGLAALGFEVTASDLSPAVIDRARKEAAGRNLSIEFSVADMRRAFHHHGRQFDVVISCDNSVPHLLSDADILAAFRQFYRCVRPGGGCIISVRDYEKEDLSRRQVKPCGVNDEDGVRWVVWQVWDPNPPTLDLTMYIVEDRGGADCRTHALRCVYYPVGITRLVDLLTQAGFRDVRRIDDRLFQPLIVGTR